MLNLIVAVTRTYGIGLNGSIPWYYPKELQHFKKVTSFNQHANVINTVIMGSTTANSLSKALPGRLNIVLSRKGDYSREGFYTVSNLIDAIEQSVRTDKLAEIFIIGGRQIYLEALKYPELIKRVYLTVIHPQEGAWRPSINVEAIPMTCDTAIPELHSYLVDHCQLVSSDTTESVDYTYNVYQTVIKEVSV